jgi:hypothetical protein
VDLSSVKSAKELEGMYVCIYVWRYARSCLKAWVWRSCRPRVCVGVPNNPNSVGVCGLSFLVSMIFILKSGLKGGGTLEQRAERLFLLKHTPLEQVCSLRALIIFLEKTTDL